MIIWSISASRLVLSRCITRPSTVMCQRGPTFQLSQSPGPVRYGEPPQPQDQSVGWPPPYGWTPRRVSSPLPSFTTGGVKSSAGNLPSSNGDSYCLGVDDGVTISVDSDVVGAGAGAGGTIGGAALGGTGSRGGGGTIWAANA